VKRQAQEKGITLAENAIDDVLTVALFPQVGLKFLENRHNPAAFEPVPQAEEAQPAAKAEKPPPPASTPWKWKAKPLW
jgi:oxaloacetate decarboxylase alpha subunit